MLTLESRARDFPSLEGICYLNTAAEGIPPPGVQTAIQEYWRDKLRGMSGRDSHFARVEECREIAARFLDLQPQEISFCSCSSEAFNLLASALNLPADAEVVVSDLDFPAGTTPWLMGPQRPQVRVWISRDGGLELGDLAPLLNARTRLVQVSLVSFYNGYRLDWAPFLKMVRVLAPSALISVDVTQAIGRFKLDCGEADCVISSTHKWALGLHGGCIVGVKEKQSGKLTTRAGGWYHLNNAFDKNVLERNLPKLGAESFSVGMPNFAAIYALDASLRYLDAVGSEAISRHADPLVKMAHEGMIKAGLTPMAPVAWPDCSGIIAFQHPLGAMLEASLRERKVHVMHSAGRVRLSIHGYNTMEDIDYFLGALNDTLATLPR